LLLRKKSLTESEDTLKTGKNSENLSLLTVKRGGDSRKHRNKSPRKQKYYTERKFIENSHMGGGEKKT